MRALLPSDDSLLVPRRPVFTAPDGMRFPGFWEYRLTEAVRQ